jgi:hypothetical protein
VSLQYDDDKHQVHQVKEFVLRQGNPAADPEWIVLIQDPAVKQFHYRIRRVGQNPADSQDGGWVETTDPVVIVE